MSNSPENPYAAPGTTSVPTRRMMSDGVPWGIWISAAAASMIMLTGTFLYLDDRDIGNIQSGPHSALAAGICLTITSIWIGRTYRRLPALLLAEALNLTTWLSMLLTVMVGFGIFHDQALRESDYRIFGMIWLGGAVGTAVIVLLSGRHNLQQPQGISNDT